MKNKNGFVITHFVCKKLITDPIKRGFNQEKNKTALN